MKLCIFYGPSTLVIISLPCSALHTMQLLMWQHNTVGMAHYIMKCF